MASEWADPGSVAEMLETGRRVIHAERAGLDALADSLDPAFAEAVALIGAASGRLIVCGVGKSGHVARGFLDLRQHRHAVVLPARR